jgi:S-adenosylmethionine synthetase
MEVEIVERKGLGHPDTICDSVMEAVSQALSRAYLNHFGRILHHNCDKGLLVAGKAEHRFGGGRVVEPLRLIIGDRASAIAPLTESTIAAIAIEAAKGWLREKIPRINPDEHLTYHVELKPGSEELVGLFSRQETVLGANDTSAAVGYAPLTESERLVLECEHYLNSAKFKARFPESGTDVKVMGIRRGSNLGLTVAMPLIDQYVETENEYFRRKESIKQVLSEYLSARLISLAGMALEVNTLDRKGMGIAGMYLSVTGTSAEDADSGEVGRGNQVNGLIALNRPRASEAAAGKNPVSHVGKIYNVLSHVLATEIHGQVQGVQEAIVWLCSRIGKPIDQPEVISVQVRLKPGLGLGGVTDAIRQIIEARFARMALFCQELASGVYPVCY